MEIRKLNINGTGSVSAKPNSIIISMVIEASDMEYENTMIMAESGIAELEECIISSGFQIEDLKTLDFSVNTNYENISDNNGMYKRIFKGYITRHELSLEFNFNMDTLSNILNKLSKCKAKPEFNITFSVLEPEYLKESAIVLAIEDAKKKAEIIVNSSEIKLGKILNINYNTNENKIVSNTRYEFMASDMVQSKRTMNITPKDINIVDNVEITWEII